MLKNCKNHSDSDVNDLKKNVYTNAKEQTKINVEESEKNRLTLFSIIVLNILCGVYISKDYQK